MAANKACYYPLRYIIYFSTPMLFSEYDLYLTNLLNWQHLDSKCRVLTATIENSINADYDL